MRLHKIAGKKLMEKTLENEKQVISYLFGELTGAERDEFEEMLFLDEDFSLFVSGVENDLIDDYIRSELKAGEKLKFENFYLKTENGCEKVSAAQILHAKLFDQKEIVAAAAETKVSFRQALIDAFRVPNLALAGSLAAILLFLLGGIWFFNRPATEIVVIDNKNQSTATPIQNISPQNIAPEKNQSETNEISEENKNTSRLDANATQNAQPNARKPAPKDSGTKEPDKNQKAPTAAPSQRVFAFSLLPPLRSSERPVLKIPPAAQIVRLRLFDNFGEKYVRYSVELSDSGGNSLWSSETAAGEKRPQKSMTVNIPANKLKADSYELAVRGISADGSVEEISFYNFVVQTK